MAAGVVFAWLISTSLAFPAEKPSVEEACLKMDELVNEMLGREISQCSPSISKRAGKYSLFFIAKKPVLNDLSDKRVWLIAIVAVVGGAMTETENFPAMRGASIDEVLTFDADFAKQGKALVLPAPVAKSIRNNLHDRIINIDQAYDQIKAAMTERVLK
jgi:hypothetical protein